MLSFLKSRVLLRIVGLLSLAVFIWFGGPYFAFADYRPLDPPRARVIAILLCGLVWLSSIVLKRRRAARADDQLAAAVVAPVPEERPSAEVVQLRERFEDAVARLQRNRRSGHSLYELPWYAVIGAPGSGKTTALVNSGLKFPLEQTSRPSPLRGVGGTRNCDWWFTDQAVLLDTAGRYTTHDSDADGDAAGWREFLALLRQHRPRRPLNGIIVAVSAVDLMTLRDREREEQIAAIRRRLKELRQELLVQLPVYVMVTKCDRIAGFSEYFDDLTQEGRAQVWGITVPYGDTASGKAPDRVGAEIEPLVRRLNERIFVRLNDERDPRRGTAILGFPHQFDALTHAVVGFVGEMCGATRFENTVLLRGVYFTSATQEGTPIDRLLGAIGRRFAVAPDAIMPGGRGKAYFIARLFPEVIFAESGLAGVNRRVELRKASVYLGAIAATVVFAVAGVVALAVSYHRNQAYLADVGASVARLAEAPAASRGDAADVVRRLDAVRAVADVANLHVDSTPFAMRWGLYQGTAVGNAARDAYLREMDAALLPQVESHIRERLTTSAGEPEKLYEYLKAYLMLGYPEHLEPTQLAFIADLDWTGPQARDRELGAALSGHFGNMLAHQRLLRPLPIDDRLVAQARSTIRQASIGGLIYRQIRLSYAGQDAGALRLDVAAGAGAERVLRRKSGVPLSTPVAAIYTAPVFKSLTADAAEQVARQFAADHWVWGEGGAPRVAPGILAKEFVEIYERDYIAVWDAIVRDIQAAPMGSLAATKDALSILSGPASPLRGLLKVIDEQTFLTPPPDAAPPREGVTGRLGQIFERGKAAAGLSPTPAGTRITTHFAPIHRLVASEGGNAPIDGTLAKLAELQQRLDPVGGQVGGAAPADPAVLRGVGEAANSLKRDAAAMPPLIAGVLAQVADRALAAITSDVRGGLDGLYREQVVRDCSMVIADRYPFVSTSNIDVPLADFGRVFGYGGVFDTFFKAHLQDLVDTSRTPWRWRTDASGRSVGPSNAMLRELEDARHIREIFFRPGSQDPEVQFRLTPVSLSAKAARVALELDGETFEYRHGPERGFAAKWPGKSPGPAAVTFEVPGLGRPNMVAQGAWGWFRLLQSARIERETDVRYVVGFSRDGVDVRLRLDAASIRHPFGDNALERFRCGAHT